MQANILYSGRVQGVGFRYTVQRYCLKMGLTGWVKNLDSKEVEILVEGQKDTIEEMCKSVEQCFQGNIRNKEISFSERRNNFKDFRITF